VTLSARANPGVMAWWLLLALRAYQAFLSPFYGGTCRFYPSCSQYAAQAIERHGARRGAWLAVKRLARCRPFSPGGYDPVPEREPGTSRVHLQKQEIA
jgi:uncharacterized protein